MTVLSTTNRTVATGNGVTTAFPCGFAVQRAGDLRVTKVSPAGTETLLALGVDYTVVAAGGPGSGIILTTALASGWTLVLHRRVPVLQDTSFVNQGAFFPRTHEAALDRIVQMIQGVSEDGGRHLALFEGDTDGSGRYDAGGNRIVDLAGPVNDDEAATKSYVDNVLQNLLALAATVSGDPPVWAFTANGTDASFVLAGMVLTAPSMYLVTLDGVVQRPTTDFTINGTTGSIVFVTAPPDSVSILVQLKGFGSGGDSGGSGIPTQYTSLTMPSPEIAGLHIRIKDPGMPGRELACMEAADGSLFWEPVVTGREG